MDMERFVERALEMCHRVAPTELKDQRLRIIPQTHLPPLLGGDTNCYGYTSPSLDMHLHHTFKDWDGQRGPVIVLGHLNIERDFPTRTTNKMLGTVLHELAHCLERPSLFRPREYHSQLIRMEAIKIAEAVTVDEVGDGTTPPWTTHEARFMRIAYHLRYRAARLNYDIRPNEVYSSERFGMSLAAEYSRTLDAEAERCLSWTFRDICQRPMPILFERIYERDKTNWFNSQALKQRNAHESDIYS